MANAPANNNAAPAKAPTAQQPMGASQMSEWCIGCTLCYDVVVLMPGALLV